MRGSRSISPRGRGSTSRTATLKYDRREEEVPSRARRFGQERAGVRGRTREGRRAEARPEGREDRRCLPHDDEHAGRGDSLPVEYEKQEGGKGLFSNVFAMNGSKDGESIAGTTKKPECIVSGGAATIAVSFQGKTVLRLLHRLPRRVQRQPGEVREGGEEVVGWRGCRGKPCGDCRAAGGAR